MRGSLMVALLLAWLPPASVTGIRIGHRAAQVRPATLGLGAADHAARRFAPMALEASGNPLLAARLRRMAPIHDYPTARAAQVVLGSVIRVMERSPSMARRPRALAALASVRSARRAAVSAADLGRTCIGSRRPSDPCIAHASSAMEHAAEAARSALDAGVPLPVVIDECRRSMRELTASPRWSP